MSAFDLLLAATNKWVFIYIYIYIYICMYNYIYMYSNHTVIFMGGREGIGKICVLVC